MINFLIESKPESFSNPTKKLRTFEILKTISFFSSHIRFIFTYFIVLRYDIWRKSEIFVNHPSDVSFPSSLSTTVPHRPRMQCKATQCLHYLGLWTEGCRPSSRSVVRVNWVDRIAQVVRVAKLLEQRRVVITTRPSSSSISPRTRSSSVFTRPCSSSGHYSTIRRELFAPPSHSLWMRYTVTISNTQSTHICSYLLNLLLVDVLIGLAVYN